MLRVPSVLSLLFRRTPRWWTVVGSVAKALEPCPNEHMWRIVILTTVRPAQPFWLSETLILRVSHFFPSVPQRTHVTDRHTHDGPPCTTILVVRDPVSKGLSFFPKCSSTDTFVLVVRDPVSKGLSFFSKYPSTDTCDGPSYPRRSVLHNRHNGQRASPKGLHIFSKCPSTDTCDGPSYPRRSVLHDRHNSQRPLS